MKPSIFSKLETAKTVLLAGMGGGFDVFCALPLYWWLRSQGKIVHLANLSFTELEYCEGQRPTPAMLKVTSGSSGSTNYYPEIHLSRWLSDRFGETPIFAIARTGAAPIAAAYRWLIEDLRPDTLILVDGGMDSLMRGDEIGLGTPQEDSASLAAAADVHGVAQKFLICLGFGIDAFHGVCHAHALENIAALIARDAFLGSWSLMNGSEEFRFYEQAYEFVQARMPRQPSIVNSSIISAVNGNFGNFHATKRTEGSALFINPLMAMYWAFQLDTVARQNLYLDKIRQTNTYQELSTAIEAFSATHPKRRPWADIPC